MQQSKYWYLSEHQLFEQLAEHDYQAIEWIASFKTCKKNEFLYMPAEDHRKVYSIKSGYVKIGMYDDHGNEIILDILKKGDWFGEITLGAGRPKSEFAMAIEDNTVLCNFNISHLENLFSQRPELAIRFTKKIGTQQINLTRRYSSIIFKDARQRLIDFFKDFIEEFSNPTTGAVEMANFLTHQDVASLNGLARQTVSTLLSQFKEEGILVFDRKKIYVPNIKNLR